MSTSNGCVDLHGMTDLKNQQVLQGKPGHYIYDGLFSCAELTDTEEYGISSFQHYLGNDVDLKQDGIYEIHAKVVISYDFNMH